MKGEECTGMREERGREREMREGERREMREERGRNPKSLEVCVIKKTKPAPQFVEKHAPLEFGHRTRKCQ